MKSLHCLSLCLLLSAGAFSFGMATPMDPNDTHPAGEKRASDALSWIDQDVDGRLDLFVLQPNGAVRLFRSNENGLFEDCTLELGLGALAPVARAIWEDVDGDSFPDLLVVHQSGAVQLLQNMKGQELLNITELSGISVTGAIDAAWNDLNLDGQPDLVLVTTAGLRLQLNLGELTFAPSSGEEIRVPLGYDTSLLTANAPKQKQPAPGAGLENLADLEETGAPVGARSPIIVSALPRQLSASSAPLTSSAGSALLQPQFLPFTSSQICVASLNDAASNGCIKASSVPSLGRLYPISSELYVDDVSGYVGVNTTAPSARLEVSVAGETGLFVNAGVVGPSAAILSSPNTSSASPTLLALAGAGGTSGFFEEGLAIGPTIGGIPNTKATLRIDGALNSELRMQNGFSFETVSLLASGLAVAGAELRLGRANGTKTAGLHAEYAGRAGGLTLGLPSGLPTVILEAEESPGTGAALRLSNAFLRPTLVLDAEGANSSEILMRNSGNVETVEILSEETSGNGGSIALSNSGGVPQINMTANVGGTGLISLRRADGTVGISLFGDVSGDGRITCDVLQITGGADLVESFATNEECLPGSVVSIDPQSPGALNLSSSPYDRRVAGVVSGAGDVRPGLHLGQPKVLQGDTPVALSGRVYVRCTNENGQIQPGDLLTSSSLPGRAMRASDSQLAFGSVIGKAMGALEGDAGLVLVLVNLQ